MMTHRIERIDDRLVVGMKTNASVITISEKTRALAQSFMPRRHEVSFRIGKHVFSIQNYGKGYVSSGLNSEFEKWVGVEVQNTNNLPLGMQPFIIKSGMYAVFSFIGSVSDFPKSRAYIFQEWLPSSKYKLDQKAHFEILSEDYSKDLQHIEEEIWIPIQEN